MGEAGDNLLAGDVGNDVLLGGSGKNIISGGQGKDSFVLDKSSSSVIADFQDGYDMLGVSSSINFSELKIFQQESDTIIGFSGNEWARLNGVSAKTLMKLILYLSELPQFGQCSF